MQRVCDFGHCLLILVVPDIGKLWVLFWPNVDFPDIQRLTHWICRYVRCYNAMASFELWNINIPQLVILFRFPRQVVACHHGLDEQFAWGSIGYAIGMTFSTTLWIMCKVLHTSGLASWKLNICTNQNENSSQVVMVMRNSASTYQDHGISSRVLTKSWTQSSLGRGVHNV